MWIMVRGGAGYIGRVVVEGLLDAGHQAVVYDNLSQGHREAVLPGAEFIQGEILDRQAVANVIKEHKIDGVIRLAASALRGASGGNPDKSDSIHLSTQQVRLDAMRSTRS